MQKKKVRKQVRKNELINAKSEQNEASNILVKYKQIQWKNINEIGKKFKSHGYSGVLRYIYNNSDFTFKIQDFKKYIKDITFAKRRRKMPIIHEIKKSGKVRSGHSSKCFRDGHYSPQKLNERKNLYI